MTAAVTGWALRTPLGGEAGAVCARLLAGERAAAPAPEGYVRDGRPICVVAAPPRDLRHRRFLPRLGLLAIEAAAEAFMASGAGGGDRLGLFSGCGGLRVDWDETLPALAGQRPDGAAAWALGLRGLHPFWLLRHLSNNVHALAATDHGARGEGSAFGGAGSGAQALQAAVRAIEAGAVDAALVLAHDSLLEAEAAVELAAGGAVATGALDALAAPYDLAAAGFVPGEAVAALVLEPVDRAGGRALARVDAAVVADGREGAPAGATLARALSRVARGERIIDGAGLANPALDAAERAALAGVTGADAILLALSSATGQLGAATPLVQVIALGALLRQGRLPPIAGLRRPAPGPLRPLAAAEPTGERAALAVSAGAPGVAGALRVEVP